MVILFLFTSPRSGNNNGYGCHPGVIRLGNLCVSVSVMTGVAAGMLRKNPRSGISFDPERAPTKCGLGLAGVYVRTPT